MIQCFELTCPVTSGAQLVRKSLCGCVWACAYIYLCAYVPLRVRVHLCELFSQHTGQLFPGM